MKWEKVCVKVPIDSLTSTFIPVSFLISPFNLNFDLDPLFQLGNSHKPPKRPDGGLCLRRTLPFFQITAQTASMWGIFFFGIFRGKRSGCPDRLPLQRARRGHSGHEGSFGVHVMEPKSMRAWLKGFENPFGIKDSEICQRVFSIFLFLELAGTAKSLERTLFAFPSRMAASWLKAKERIAPAVDRPIPGKPRRSFRVPGIFP